MDLKPFHLPCVIFALAVAGAVVLSGCEGDRGPAGPAGPGLAESEVTYLGGNGGPCRHCHARIVGTVANCKHTDAFADLGVADRANLYCVQCHTTGFDSEVQFGDTLIEPGAYGPDTYGYDDYVGVPTAEAAERRAMLAGVQCESCHGPLGPAFNDHSPRLTLATGIEGDTSVSLCAPCHRSQLEEWLDSGHGTVSGIDLAAFNEEFGHSPCFSCHTSEGFVKNQDPAFATREFDEYNFIGCPTCHDPHAGEADGGNIYQIRTLSPVEVVYAPGYTPGDPGIPRMEGYDTGQLCARCHHGRRDAANVAGQIERGTQHFGPHGSPQMDTYIGAGCYEIPDYDYDRVAAHQGIINACVYCHMVREVEEGGTLQDHAFHTFEPDVGNCEPCHSLTDFNFHNIQTIVAEKMDEIASLLGYADTEAFFQEGTGWDSRAPGVQVWQREVAYAMVFVHADGSRGVHNPEYVIDLLDNAIDYAERNLGLAGR